MRIISDFHDYYDSVQRTGMDKEVVYDRETSEVQIKEEYEVYRRVSSKETISLQYLGFCGDIYKVYIIDRTDKPLLIYFDYYDFKEESLALGITNEYDFGRKWWKSSFDKFRDENVRPLQELFHTYQVPIFLVKTSPDRDKQKIILNPNLKDLKFYTIKDTYTTYQDIFQFVAGVLNARENKMVKISDSDKIAKHGFDKWSFRKMPGDKK